MAVLKNTITDRYALYSGDCVQGMADLPSSCIDLSVYSPPFGSDEGAMYHYSSSDYDLSNCRDYAEFLAHYDLVVEQVSRLTKPGCMTAVHLKDVVSGRALIDLQGDVIRMHQRHGFDFYDRKMVWKDPLKEAFRTRALALRHQQMLKDSTPCRSALPDYIVVLQKEGTRKVPVAHPEGLRDYAGELDPRKRERMGYTAMPDHLLETGATWKGKPNDNPLSHWIFRRYASPLWDDVRQSRVLPYRAARETEEEKHVHPLQLDVIERAAILWSNPGEKLLTPFMGVGSEVYGAVQAGRFGVGFELKESYFRQAEKNLLSVGAPLKEQPLDLFEDDERMAA